MPCDFYYSCWADNSWLSTLVILETKLLFEKYAKKWRHEDS